MSYLVLLLFVLLIEPPYRTVLKHEREEAEEAESAVGALRRRVESEREVITSLDANIQTLRARVANLREGQFSPVSRRRTPLPSEYFPTERQRERDTLAMHAKPMDAELLTYERSMGLFIEGVGPEQLLFRYTIKGDDSSRSTPHEASFVLDLSSQPTFKGAVRCCLQPLYSQADVT